ncbi:4a-hydroxytetrahydrobiopterin dehydratase [soil metagenome]
MILGMPETKLADRHSCPLPKGAAGLNKKQISALLQQVRGWKIEKGELVRELKFKNYFQTMPAVVAIAMLAQSEDHHPDLHVGYNKLQIRYSTHSVGGLSENDFICAAKINQLLPKASKE